MKKSGLIFVFLCLLVFEAISVSDDRFAVEQQQVVAYYSALENGEKPDMIQLQESFWLSALAFRNFEAEDVRTYCRIIDSHATAADPGQAFQTLELFRQVLLAVSEKAELDRLEQISRCLHRETGEQKAFEQTAIFKQLRRKRYALAEVSK